jgi:hypothetical protein
MSEPAKHGREVMANQFVISRNGDRRLMVCWGDYRAEHLEDDPKSLKKCLGYLGLGQAGPTAFAQLQEALERFYGLENRSLAKFGKPKMFRIWRVDAKTLQIDFKGGYAELNGKAKSDAALKRCLRDLGANALLVSDLKRELAEFLRDEQTAK